MNATKTRGSVRSRLVRSAGHVLVLGAATAAAASVALTPTAGCVPSGSAPPYDAGAAASAAPTFRPSVNVMTSVFEDTFDRADASEWPVFEFTRSTPDAAPPRKIPLEAASPTVSTAPSGEPAADAGSLLATLVAKDAGAAPSGPPLGPNWLQVRTSSWHIENGRLCVQGAHNHGIWLTKVLPVNARIEFDAISFSDDGDLKAEVWGDGRSAATSISYTNATSYLAIFGGWKNTIHALARLDEHGKDRREVPVDKSSDDPRQRPVTKGQTYRFKIERSDGRTVRWWIDNTEMLSWADAQPLAGEGHDHFGFNEWEVKVCFDNVKVTPL